MSFASKVGSHFSGFTVIARQVEDGHAATFELPAHVDLAPLPGYPNLRRVLSVLRALPATVPALWRAVGSVDIVWLTGVHPYGPLTALVAALRRRTIVLLLRQDTMRYFRARLPSWRWLPVLAPLKLLELFYRMLAKRHPVTAVGPEIATQYGGAGPRLLVMSVTNFSVTEGAARDPTSPIGRPANILAVGRLVLEKNPRLAARALAILNAPDPGRYELTWVGKGPMRDELRAAAEHLGVSDCLNLPGFIPAGPELFARYRAADVLVHTSLTEGVPGVVLEALASAVPVVATDVGGVAAALDGGRAGLLVPARDAAALAAAVRRMVGDPELRTRCVARGLEVAGGLTSETESERVARFLSAARGA